MFEKKGDLKKKQRMRYEAKITFFYIFKVTELRFTTFIKQSH